MKQFEPPPVPEVPASSSAAVRARVQRSTHFGNNSNSTELIIYLFFVLSILLHYCNPMYVVLFGSIYSLLFVY